MKLPILYITLEYIINQFYTDWVSSNYLITFILFCVPLCSLKIIIKLHYLMSNITTFKKYFYKITVKFIK